MLEKIYDRKKGEWKQRKLRKRKLQAVFKDKKWGVQNLTSTISALTDAKN